jgi:hypothetical protein
VDTETHLFAFNLAFDEGMVNNFILLSLWLLQCFIAAAAAVLHESFFLHVALFPPLTVNHTCLLPVASIPGESSVCAAGTLAQLSSCLTLQRQAWWGPASHSDWIIGWLD